DRVLSVPEIAPLTEMASAMVIPFVPAPFIYGATDFCEHKVGSQLETSQTFKPSARFSTDNQLHYVRWLFFCLLIRD
ncbi:MAG: hypothetical protein ACKOBK_07615, partial [Acidimicrobiaceae bacterium]